MTFKISYSIVHILLINFSLLARSERPVVKTSYGRIVGNVLSSGNGNPYYAFQEIPYASPPVGNLRFKEPIPPKEWVEVLHTTENTKICHQIHRANTPEGLTETEDCLYLNIYTPKIQESGNTTNLLPVLVWIHGGVFENGDATFQTFGPKHFMDYGVIIVTMNYRVGPFGFLTTEDGVIPANIGLKDQNFALQWVQSNIQQFGGDPAKVTIFGESAGAVSVSYHLLNKNYEDLFRGAILESGTAISSFSHQRWARYYAFETAYAMSVGFTSRNSTELLLFLQSVPAEILKNVRLTIPAEKEMGIGSHRKRIWIPVIEDDSLNGTFITGPMHENILNGNIVKVPIMLGFTSEEELKFIDYDVAAESRRFDNNLELLIHNKFEMSEENKTLAGTEFRKIYTNGTFEDTYGSIVKFQSDEALTTPITRHAVLQRKYTEVFLYEFSHRGKLGGTHVLVNGTESVAHGEELYYLWDMLGRDSTIGLLPVSDVLTRNRLLKLWTNFAKYQNPTPEADALLQYVTWPKVSKWDVIYLNINTTLEVKTDPKEYHKFALIIDKYVTGPLTNY